MKLLVFIFILLSSVGCSNNSALQFFGYDIIFEKSVKDTKKVDLIKSLETKAILNATYLNVVDKKFNSKTEDIFLVGIYIIDDERDDEFQGINNPNYHITLNNQNYRRCIELNSSHIMYGHIPLYNNWAKYYEVSFPKTFNKVLKLKHKTIGEVKLKF